MPDPPQALGERLWVSREPGAGSAGAGDAEPGDGEENSLAEVWGRAVKEVQAGLFYT